MNGLLSSLFIINTTSWMYNNRNLLYDKTIYDISLPGTHDSSTYNINGSQYINLPKQYSQLIKLANILHIPINNIIKGWVKTQNLNIYEQLNLGVRYLDLRISYYNNNWHVHHNYIIGDKLSVMLDQIYVFLNENKGEIILIELSHVFNSTQKELNILNNMIKNQFYNLLCRKEEYLNNTIEYLVNTNQRLLIFSPTDFFLPEYLIINTWANTANGNKLHSFNNNIMKKWNNHQYFYLLKLSWILTPNVYTIIQSLFPLYHKNLFQFEHKEINYYSEWSKQFIDNPIRCPVFPNIVIIDFIEYSFLIQIILNSLYPCVI